MSFRNPVLLLTVAFATFSTVSAADILTVESALAQQIIDPQLAMQEVQTFTESRILPMPEAASVEQWETYAAQVRKDVFDKVVFAGEARKWRDIPTKVEWQDTIGGGPGYRIRKLRYEVIPGMWTSALLYEPNTLEGRVPVIMNVNGHDRPLGKAAESKQLRCINQAKRGMIALNVEWLGMGQLNTPGFGHYCMNQMNLCGTSGLAPFYLTMSRGLDILLQHTNADPERVGVAGLSGGGWQTIFISALDTRVTLCNPVAGYSSLQTRARFLSDLGDSEQTPCDFATVTDYAQLTAMLAPRPFLLTKNAEDQCCFKAAHALPPLLEAAMPVYKLYGRRENLQYHINHDPGTHNFGLDNRQQFYRMLGDHFMPKEPGFDSDEIPSDDELKSKEELNVQLPDDNQDFNSKALELSDQLSRTLPENATELSKWQTEKRPLLKGILRSEIYDVLPIIQSEKHSKTLNARWWWLRFDGQWTAPATELSLPGSDPKKLAILISDAGRDSTAPRAKKLLNAGYRVLAIDPLYFGESKIAQKDFLFAILVSCTGHRMLGIQSEQVCATATWAKSHFKCDEVKIAADGPRTSLIALAAAAINEKAIDQVELHQSLGSLRELLERNRGMNEVPESLCFGLLKQFDIVQLVAAAGPSKVHFIDPSDRCVEEFKSLPETLRPLATNIADSPTSVAWVKQAGGSKHDKIRGITVDAQGNCYVTGEFTDEARFADRTVTSRGSMDFVLAKYSPRGELIWLQTAGGTEIDRGYSVAVDAAGNAYVTGHYQSPEFHIGDQTFTSRGDYDYFVAKYDVDGKFQWAEDGGGKGYDYGHGIAVTPNGNVYVSGSFASEVTLGTTKSPNANGRSLFVAKYDTDGKLNWSRMAGTGPGQSGHNIAVGPDGDCYVSGFISGVVELSGRKFGAATRVNDIFVARLNADGHCVWAATAGGESNGLSTGVAVDDQGRCYVTGMFKDTAVFGSTTLVSSGEHDIFVAGFDPDGKPSWAYSGGGKRTDYGLGIAIDTAGNCYVTGEFTDDIEFMGEHHTELGRRDLYVARFSPAGKLNWLEVMGGRHNDLSYAVAVDHDGNCFLSGAFSPDTHYQTHKLKGRGHNDIFLMKLKQK